MKAVSLASLAGFLFRLVLGGFYLIAGGLKVSDPGKFADAVANYRLVPYHWINLLAITLPWIEVVAGLFLIFGIWLKASAGLINLMTVVFIVAIASAVTRGLNIECGCFGTVGGRQVGLTAIGEDAILLILGVWLMWRGSNSNREATALPAALAPTQSEPCGGNRGAGES